jgi:magnesium transporter
METDIYSVRAEDDREEVAQKIARYDLLAIPVADADNRLIGIVTHDDVVDVLVQAATEDAEKMGGVVPIRENYMEAGFFRVWRSRVFWLSLLFVAELATFMVLEHYEDAIKAITVLSLFIPLCLSTGGNSGSQAATLITRALALRQISPGHWWRVLRRELVMGLALGAALGGIGFVRAAFTREETLRNDELRAEPFEVRMAAGERIHEVSHRKYIIPAGALQLVGKRYRTESIVELPPETELPQPRLAADGETSIHPFPERTTFSTAQVQRWDLASIVGIAVAVICLLGTLVGALLPLFFRLVGWDPALASSPFVATAVDVLGILIFFGIAVRWLPGLGS